MQGQPRLWWNKWLARSDRNERVNLNLFLNIQGAQELIPPAYVVFAGILERFMGARNRVRIGLSYQPALQIWVT